MMILIGAAAQALALVVLLHGVPWTVFSVAALRKPARNPFPAVYPRLAVVVPAHNEELLLPRCLRSLRRAVYRHPVETIVVADNCTDETAEIARGFGVTVIERTNREHVGKSFALDAALAYLADGKAKPDAVVFVDADSEVDDGFLDALGRALASGDKAVQAYYQPTTSDSALGRLRTVAFGLVHWARPLGMARFGLGSAIKGNGFAIRWALVRDGLGASGLAEDASLTLSLARRGVPVAFVPAAKLAAHMAQDYASAKTQDERWERGRLSLIRDSFGAAAAAVRQRRFAAAAGALDVASLPLSLLVLLTLVSITLGALSSALTLPSIAASSLITYVAIGIVASRLPWETISSIAFAPRYLLHKIGVYVSLARPGSGWERTDRNGTGSPTNEAP